jgi:hypothetical protein
MLRTTIQISIEDIEMMLDLLGQEQHSESEDRKHLRRRLQEALQFLREHGNTSHTG